MILYVTEPGTTIKKKLGRYIIEKDNSVISEVPIETLDSVVMYTGTNITNPCVNSFLEKGIDVIYTDSFGKYRGRLLNSDLYNVERQFEQFSLYNDEDFNLSMAKQTIVAKINNSKVILQKFNRNDGILKKLKYFKKFARNAKSIDELRGIEGIAAKEYFSGISEILPKEFEFTKRINYKAKDKFNVLLNFGYSLLRNDIHNMVISKGLNPYIGFFHKIRNGHDALVSDFMEEFRACVVDKLILNIISKYKDYEEYFSEGQFDNLFISKDFKKLIMNEYEKIMQKSQSYSEYNEQKISMRYSIFKQVEGFIGALSKKDYSFYKPFKIR